MSKSSGRFTKTTPPSLDQNATLLGRIWTNSIMLLLGSNCSGADSECSAAERGNTSSQPQSPIAGPRNSDALFSAHYHELLAIARRQLSLNGDAGLDATALVHEAFLKICGTRNIEFKQREQFFSYVKLAMRHILLDFALRRASTKSGGQDVHVDISDPLVDQVGTTPLFSLHLDSALTALEARSPRAARVMELYLFDGHSIETICKQLRVARRTVDREWRSARLYIQEWFG